uniref:Kelch domain-containing protein 10 n=1 Tax=Steinernema glaseri TaxID=37863 RepID=A0A1I7ZNJ9_9BILA
MGQFHSNRDFYCDKLKVLDLNTFEWSEPNVSGDIPSGRRSHSAWTYRNKMYIFGGFYSVDDKHYNELFEFDPVTSRWSKIRALGACPTPRRRQCTVVLGDRVFLFGGTSPCRKVGNENYSYNTGLQDLDDLHILDFAPSLFTLSAVRVIELNLHKPYARYLPASINNTLRSMTTTNKANIPPSRFDLQG